MAAWPSEQQRRMTPQRADAMAGVGVGERFGVGVVGV